MTATDSQWLFAILAGRLKADIHLFPGGPLDAEVDRLTVGINFLQPASIRGFVASRWRHEYQLRKLGWSMFYQNYIANLRLFLPRPEMQELLPQQSEDDERFRPKA